VSILLSRTSYGEGGFCPGTAWARFQQRRDPESKGCKTMHVEGMLKISQPRRFGIDMHGINLYIIGEVEYTSSRVITGSDTSYLRVFRIMNHPLQALSIAVPMRSVRCCSATGFVKCSCSSCSAAPLRPTCQRLSKSSYLGNSNPKSSVATLSTIFENILPGD